MMSTKSLIKSISTLVFVLGLLVIKINTVKADCAGCGHAPNPMPSYTTVPYTVGPFTSSGKLVIYFKSWGGDSLHTASITANGNPYSITLQTPDKVRVATNIQINAGDSITVNNIFEPDQGAPECAPAGPPYVGTGWQPVNGDLSCGSNLPGPPTGCLPMGAPSVASTIAWAQSYNDASYLSQECWADWREWPGDYDFNDYFIWFAIEVPPATPPPVTPSPTPEPGTYDIPLWVRGSVVAYGGINLQRRLTEADNATTPAEFFEYAPDLELLFPKDMATNITNWKEVAP